MRIQSDILEQNVNTYYNEMFSSVQNAVDFLKVSSEAVMWSIQYVSKGWIIVSDTWLYICKIITSMWGTMKIELKLLPQRPQSTVMQGGMCSYAHVWKWQIWVKMWQFSIVAISQDTTHSFRKYRRTYLFFFCSGQTVQPPLSTPHIQPPPQPHRSLPYCHLKTQITVSSQYLSSQNQYKNQSVKMADSC